jgi:hypothetical protein
MHVPSAESDLSVEIEFRADRFDYFTTLLGATTELERAALIQMDPKTLRRVREGTTRVGHEFMAKTVGGLRRHEHKIPARRPVRITLDSLFAVRVCDPESELVAA